MRAFGRGAAASVEGFGRIGPWIAGRHMRSDPFLRSARPAGGGSAVRGLTWAWSSIVGGLDGAFEHLTVSSGCSFWAGGRFLIASHRATDNLGRGRLAPPSTVWGRLCRGSLNPRPIRISWGVNRFADPRPRTDGGGGGCWLPPQERSCPPRSNESGLHDHNPNHSLISLTPNPHTHGHTDPHHHRPQQQPCPSATTISSSSSC